MKFPYPVNPIEPFTSKKRKLIVQTMGKQINYWMDYDNFLSLSQKALDLGCTIVKEDLDQGRVIESESISLITPYETYSRTSYYFHLPEAGEIRILTADGKDYLDYGFTATGNAMIEADYSLIIDEPTGAAGIRRKKEIHRARIYCISGYYDENEKYIPRPDCLTNVYNSLARFIKKLAPSTKIPQYTHKAYITPTCLTLVNQAGYKLS